MKLVFVHGVPGVGKLTVASELARLTGWPLFHNHLTVDLVSAVFPFGSQPFVALREQIWLSVFREAASDGVSLIFTFTPENTVRPQFVEDTIDIVGSSGGRVYFVELICTEGELERRIENPSRKQFGKLSSIKQYRGLKAAGALQFPKLPTGLSLDTSASSPADTASLIREFLFAGES
jgi:chloramphenicol 3-O-phosphotransferase